jgi:predicted enzyme involved in methoxymalonyl-ACP biosynthesis
MTAAGTVTGGTVKCVVWDIDNTLLTGTYLESPDEPPGADPVLGAVLAELGARGILHALASKNPPEAAAHTARVTGWRFAAAECGWGSKSDALTKIAAPTSGPRSVPRCPGCWCCRRRRPRRPPAGRSSARR